MTVVGLEKFSHLEDKIYRAVDLCKTLKQEKDDLERELALMRRDMAALAVEKEKMEDRVERLLADRDAMRLRVEAMLDAIAVLEMESESLKK